MTGPDPIDPLRKATQRLHEAEVERNRILRALRSQRLPLARLSEAADMSLGKVHALTRPSTNASVGYEGRSADELIDALVGAGVGALVDVRENATSRKPGLSKRALAERCRVRGIEYLHEPSLGNPRENREDFRAGVATSRSAYEQHLNATGTDALRRVASLLRDRTVALLCFEADHSSCHRSIVADHLRRLDPLATVQPV
jgi:uncharacterized protein (DUF488 family)